jgi:hypothetical protein
VFLQRALYRRPRIRYRSRPSGALSSAVEHHLDMVGVSGSIPLARTIQPKGYPVWTSGWIGLIPRGRLVGPRVLQPRLRGAGEICAAPPGQAHAPLALRVGKQCASDRTVRPLFDNQTRKEGDSDARGY